jgi:oxygen-dependent protoporphyrinogen oxidase
MDSYVPPWNAGSEINSVSDRQYADVIIVGGGISGLSLAWRLTQMAPALRIRVLEAGDRPGGTAWTDYENGFLVEHGANGFLANKTSTWDLVRELGLANELVAANQTARYRYVLDKQGLYLLPNGLWSLFRFPLLSWRAKWAILTEYWRHSASSEDDESVYEFISRRTNWEVADLFAELLVTGIYAGNPHELSMAACFPRVAQMERRAGSVTAGFFQERREQKRHHQQPAQAPVKRSQLYSLRRGMRQLIETLAQRLAPVLHLASPVHRIEYVDSEATHRWRVSCRETTWHCRELVLACPAYVQAQLLEPLCSELAREVKTIPYVPVAVIALGYRENQLGKRLVGFGYLTTSRSQSRMLGAQWCSSIFPDRAPEGHVLMRYMAGGSRRLQVLEQPDDFLVSEAHDEARRLLAIQGAPCYSRVIRWPRAIPQYTLGHHKRLARIRNLLSQWPGLHLTGNAYEGVSLNDCVERSNQLATYLTQRLNAVLATQDSA